MLISDDLEELVTPLEEINTLGVEIEADDADEEEEEAKPRLAKKFVDDDDDLPDIR